MRFCAHCGSQIPSPDTRFCGECGAGLAAISAPTGPSGAPAPAPGAGPAPSPAPTPAPVAGPAPVHGPGQDAGPASAPRSTSRIVRPIIVALLAVTAVVVVGLTVWKVWLATPTGAETPEQAVEEIIAALAAQDPVAALRMVDPEEVSGIDEVYQALQGKLSGTGLVPEKGFVEAAQVSVDSVDLLAERHSDNVYQVDVTGGEVTVAFDRSKLPKSVSAAGDDITRSEYTFDLRDAGEHAWRFDADALFRHDEAFDRSVPSFIVTQSNGRWHVSIIGTVAQNLSQHTAVTPDYSLLDTESEPDAVVGSEPEDALRNTAKALSTGDLDRVLETLPYGQFRILQAYTHTIRDVMNSYDVDVSAEVARLSTREEKINGDLTKLVIDRGEAQGSYTSYDDYGSGIAALEGTCIVVDGDRACLPQHVTELTGIDSFYLMVRKVDDGWQVDPLATLVAYAEQTIDAMSAETMLAIADLDHLLEATPVTPGQPVDVALTAAGRAMISVEAKAGDVITIVDPDGTLSHTPQLLPPDRWLHPVWSDLAGGSWHWESDGKNGIAAFPVTQDGTHRFRLMAGWDVFDESPEVANVTVDISTPPQLDVGDTVELQFGDFGLAQYQVSRGNYGVSENLTIVGDDGTCNDVCLLSGSVLALADGPGQSLEEPPAVGFSNGGRTHSGWLDYGGSVEVNVRVPASGATLHADGEFDLVLRATPQSGGEPLHADASAQCCESLLLSEGTWSVSVTAWDDDGSGDVTLEIY